MATNNDIITNRKARRDFFIIETFEAGIELKGSEIKSIRQRRANLHDSYARIDKGEIVLFNMHVNPYEFARREEVDPVRPRKLLLKKKEIKYLISRVMEKGLTLVPLRLYLKKSLAKIELALAQGKKHFDKRDAIKTKQASRDISRALRRRR